MGTGWSVRVLPEDYEEVLKELRPDDFANFIGVDYLVTGLPMDWGSAAVAKFIAPWDDHAIVRYSRRSGWNKHWVVRSKQDPPTEPLVNPDEMGLKVLAVIRELQPRVNKNKAPTFSFSGKGKGKGSSSAAKELGRQPARPAHAAKERDQRQRLPSQVQPVSPPTNASELSQVLRALTTLQTTMQQINGRLDAVETALLDNEDEEEEDELMEEEEPPAAPNVKGHGGKGKTNAPAADGGPLLRIRRGRSEARESGGRRGREEREDSKSRSRGANDGE